VINVKQGRVGGVLAAARMARYCASRGVPVWSGGMDETGIGRAVNIHLQTMPEFSIPGDTSETSRYFTEDIVEPPVTLDARGYIAVPDGPGFGATVLEDRVSRFTIDRERVR
jgi:O-succinylbenzoate synthase